MARWIPLVRDGGFYASNAWTPLVMDGGYTHGGGEPEPAWEYKYVAGMSPLLLAAALGKPIKSLTQYGLCSQASTPTPDAPVDIMCNNGALKYGVLGKNWFDDAATRRLEELGDLGLSNRWGETIDVPAGTYTVAWTQEVDGSLYIRVFDGGKWGDYQSIPQSGRTVTLTGDGIILVYCGSSSNRQDNLLGHKIQVEVGSTATAYEPYKGKGIYADGTPEVLTVSATGAEPQTVTDIPMLLSVNDYKDEAEIISGAVTHKVGIKVLDGTESWALSDSGTTHRFRGTKPSDCHTPASRAPSVCTHFKYVSTESAVGGMFIGASQYWYFIPTDQTIDTVDEWTAWLKAQYAQGTPVIVLYPLKEEATESVTPQALSTSGGDNVVSVTANVSPIQLSAEYAILSEAG